MSEQAATSARPDQSGSVYHYFSCGLRIESDLPLPALLSADGGGGAPDIRIAAADVPEQLDDGVELHGPTWQRTANQFLLRVRGVGRFLIEGTSAVRYMLEGDGAPEDLTAFLTGSVLGILLHLRGSTVLHASAVVVAGRAILFCGASGAGKSTLAAALGERGYPMLSDDLGVLSLANGELVVDADGRTHKLWDHAISGLSLKDRRGDGVRHQINKFYVAPRAAHSTAKPVGGFYELAEQRSGEQMGIRPLALPDIALVIRQHAYRARLMWRFGQKADYFRIAALIARQAHAATLLRPFDFTRMDAVMDLLEEDWRMHLGTGV